MEEFFKSQMDYILFIYGLVFIILYSVIQTQQKGNLPWKWLALFALFSGIARWTLMVEMSWLNNFLPVFYFIFITVSLLCLVEFGRTGIFILYGKSTRWWIYLPLVCIIAIGSTGGHSGLSVMSHYMGFIASLLAGLVFYKYVEKPERENPCLKFSAICIICYGLLLLAEVPETNFLIASVINKTFFLKLFRFPIQLAGIITVILFTVSVWRNFNLLCKIATTSYQDRLKSQYSFGTAILSDFFQKKKKEENFIGSLRKLDIIGLLFSRRIATAGMFLLLFITVICGWAGTEIMGKDADRMRRNSLLNTTKMIALSLCYERIGALSGTPEDIENPDYKYIKEQLVNVSKENPRCRYIYLLSRKEGKIVFLADSEPQNSGNYSPPGEVYENPSLNLQNLLYDGEPFVEGPLSDRWGTWMTGFSSVYDPSIKHPVAALGIDIDAKDWKRIVYKYRRDSIMITLFISILLIIFFAVHQKSIETSQKIAAAEKEKIENELKIAHDIQMGLVPKIFPPFPEHHEFSIYAYIEPAKQVGGDLYDFFMQDENHLCFTIGDVSDKGVPASLFMAVTKSLFRTIASRSESPGIILTRVNREVCSTNESLMFITLFCGILDIETGKLVYSNAGHNIPYIVRNKEAIKLEKPCNCVIGVKDDEEYADKELIMKEGDYLFTYTDGITEAMNKESEVFGEKKLEEKLTFFHYLSPEKMIKSVKKSINSFVSGYEQSDDITMLAIKYNGSNEP